MESGTTYVMVDPGAASVTANTAGAVDFRALDWFQVFVPDGKTANIGGGLGSLTGQSIVGPAHFMIQRDVNNTAWQLVRISDPDQLIIRNANFTVSQPSGTKYLVIGNRTATLPSAGDFPEGYYIDFHIYDGAAITFAGQTVNGGSGPFGGSSASANTVYRLWRASGAADWYARQLGGAGSGGGGVTVSPGNPGSSQAAAGVEGDLWFNKGQASLFILADVGGKKWFQIN
jgi:hypothetical protein